MTFATMLSIFAALANSCAPGATEENTLATAQKWVPTEAVDDMAFAFMAENGIPGLAIGITRDGEQRIYTYGVASRETRSPVTADTLFELGSISKTFNATLAAYAQSKGKLSLTDRVGDHVKKMEGTAVGDIQLWQLGTHSAGGFPLQFPAYVRTDADADQYYLNWAPSYVAGTRRTYANPSIALLGIVSASVIGKSYAEAMQAFLLPELNLRDTWIRVPVASEYRYAQGYNSTDLPVRLTDGPLADEAYGMRSSAKDMLHFLEQNIRQETGIPSLDDALKETQVGYFKIGPMTQALVWEKYALPVSMDELVAGNSALVSGRDLPVTKLSLQSDTSRYLFNKTGGTGGFGAYAIFIPSERSGIVILANKSHSNESRVRLAYSLLVRSTIAEVRAPGQTSKRCP